jgi:hypothetical protein
LLPDGRAGFFEDFTIGDVCRSRLGRTIHTPFAERGPFGKPRVSTLSLVTGLSVTDVSENARANLAWDDIRLSNPVFPIATAHWGV